MVRLLITGVCLLLSAGCGNSDRLPTYKATGTVKFDDGKPVEEGSISLSASGLPPGRGFIENGEFSVTTYEEGDGAVAGTFQVAIRANPPVDYDPDSRGPAPIGAKAKYERPETSGIEFEVTPKGANTLDIVLERGN